MADFKEFIKENIALSESRLIGIYSKKGVRVGWIPLNQLTPPDKNEKSYSFGALSDVHVVYDTAADDFKRALTYFNNDADVAFTCICGDLTDNGTEAQIQQYKEIVDNYSPDTPVYAVAGNHENYLSTSSAYFSNYTGKPLYYSFTHNNDVFIMMGIVSGTETQIFTEGQLQWLYETLEANRNRRCFLFFHIPPAEGCGDILDVYTYTKLSTAVTSQVFKSLLKHYPNVIFFHGHTHMKFYLQQYGMTANYDRIFGCHSIHIPSLSVPRDVDISSATYRTIYAESEGYVVDVYKNGIHLRGRDFVKGEFLPIASYWLDTTLKEVEAGTYTDTTGTIKVN